MFFRKSFVSIIEVWQGPKYISESFLFQILVVGHSMNCLANSGGPIPMFHAKVFFLFQIAMTFAFEFQSCRKTFEMVSSYLQEFDVWQVRYESQKRALHIS